MVYSNMMILMMNTKIFQCERPRERERERGYKEKMHLAHKLIKLILKHDDTDDEY